LMDGQRTDLRIEPVEWAEAAVVDIGFDRLTTSPAPPVRRIEELRARSVHQLAPDRQVVDLGQNINGWVRLTNLGPAGTTLQLTHGELLDPDGDVTTDHLKAFNFETFEVLSAG